MNPGESRTISLGQAAVLTGVPSTDLQQGHEFAWGPGMQWRIDRVGDQDVRMTRIAHVVRSAGQFRPGVRDVKAVTTEGPTQFQSGDTEESRATKFFTEGVPEAGWPAPGALPFARPQIGPMVDPSHQHHATPARGIVERVDVLGPQHTSEHPSSEPRLKDRPGAGHAFWSSKVSRLVRATQSYALAHEIRDLAEQINPHDLIEQGTYSDVIILERAGQLIQEAVAAVKRLTAIGTGGAAVTAKDKLFYDHRAPRSEVDIARAKQISEADIARAKQGDAEWLEAVKHIPIEYAKRKKSIDDWWGRLHDMYGGIGAKEASIVKANAPLPMTVSTHAEAQALLDAGFSIVIGGDHQEAVAAAVANAKDQGKEAVFITDLRTPGKKYYFALVKGLYERKDAWAAAISTSGSILRTAFSHVEFATQEGDHRDLLKALTDFLNSRFVSQEQMEVQIEKLTTDWAAANNLRVDFIGNVAKIYDASFMRWPIKGSMRVTEASMIRKSESLPSDPLEAYLVTALWSTSDESTPQGGLPLDRNYTIADVVPEARAAAEADLNDFLKRATTLIEGQNLAKVAYHFWLTRNRHGAGFWDGDYPEKIGKQLTDLAHGFRELDPYVGDDGKIYGFGEKFVKQAAARPKIRKPVFYDDQEYRLEVWQERDRLHIGLERVQDDATVADWWDEDAAQMFEDGFFKHSGIFGKLDQNDRVLFQSVIDYAKSVGLIAPRPTDAALYIAVNPSLKQVKISDDKAKMPKGVGVDLRTDAGVAEIPEGQWGLDTSSITDNPRAIASAWEDEGYMVDLSELIEYRTASTIRRVAGLGDIPIKSFAETLAFVERNASNPSAYLLMADGEVLSVESFHQNKKQIESATDRPEEDPNWSKQWQVIGAGINADEPNLRCAHSGVPIPITGDAYRSVSVKAAHDTTKQLEYRASGTRWAHDQGHAKPGDRVSTSFDGTVTVDHGSSKPAETFPGALPPFQEGQSVKAATQRNPRLMGSGEDGDLVMVRRVSPKGMVYYSPDTVEDRRLLSSLQVTGIGPIHEADLDKIIEALAKDEIGITMLEEYDPKIHGEDPTLEPGKRGLATVKIGVRQPLDLSSGIKAAVDRAHEPGWQPHPTDPGMRIRKDEHAGKQIWMRLGDSDDYTPQGSSVEDAGAGLGDVLRQVWKDEVEQITALLDDKGTGGHLWERVYEPTIAWETGMGFGLHIGPFQGQDFVSVFWGDDNGEALRKDSGLNAKEREEFLIGVRQPLDL